MQELRTPTVLNKYNITPKDLRRVKVINRTKIQTPPFWRNDVIKAWCLTDTTIKDSRDEVFCTYNSYWIGIYDEDSPHKNKFAYTVSSYGGMCSYVFDKFFDPTEIEHEIDLEIQEKFLATINWLLDEKIIELN